jgi:hypothetical protein
MEQDFISGIVIDEGSPRESEFFENGGGSNLPLVRRSKEVT